ncbi:uncharacterized protein BO97DRAFT_355503, partial [Aspergillus homomorphus CBS 101889]
RDIVLEIPPPLLGGPNRTESNAIHPIYLKGDLYPWSGFRQEVINHWQSYPWRAMPAALAAQTFPPTTATTNTEFVYAADENGLQDRWNQNIGQIMGVVFDSQRMDMRLADFKANLSDCTEVLDSVICTTGGQAIAVGEFTVFWVDSHEFQIAEYMAALGLKHGYLSIYNQTIFLKVEVPAGKRYTGLFYSDVINRSDTSVTLRQAFFYFAIKTRSDIYHTVQISRNAQWTVTGKKFVNT